MMEILALAGDNLISPIVLSFALGLAAIPAADEDAEDDYSDWYSARTGVVHPAGDGQRIP